ncbi:GntR family transcriptional regulator [Pseudonocardia sp. GCM10023141]|uniref:GntR family transcriptional regulator n=1 Tax=Pseudonocardia sp. GCM10023141 TaxID=3252653 RepID=UPI003611E273
MKQSLLGSIARGEFSPDEPFITQREIVERFEVSTTTAVRALNELVADGIVVRIRGRGTFVAQRPARPVAASGQRLVTYVSPGSGGVHESDLLSGLAAELATLGYQLAMEHTRSVAHEEEVLRRIGASGTQGVVLFPRDRSTAAGAVEEMQRHGVAVTVVDRYLPDLPTDAILFDDFAVGYEVTAAMLDRGHCAPAMLWSESDVTSVRDRLSGHYRALRDRGLPELPERSALRGYDPMEPTTRRQRLRSMLESEAGLTALICGNAPTLALAVSDLLAMETGFPGSVELASMDQSLPYDVSPLAVVSARLPTREMGVEAAHLVHERVQGSTAPLRHVVLKATVQVADRGANTLGVIGAR